MAYSEALADKIRKALSSTPNVKELHKMGGVSFMVNGKLVARAHSTGDMMLRCKAEMTEELLQKKGANRFEMKGKPMKGWLLISPAGTDDTKDLKDWITLAIQSIDKNTA